MGDQDSINQRIEEVKILYSWLKDRFKQDQDKYYVIVGDWNDKIDSISFNNIMKDDTLAILTREDAESRDKDAVSYVRGTKKSLIDHIVISQDAKGEYIDKSIEIVRSDKVVPKFISGIPEGYSDHIPLVARFVYTKEAILES